MDVSGSMKWRRGGGRREGGWLMGALEGPVVGLAPHDEVFGTKMVDVDVDGVVYPGL